MGNMGLARPPQQQSPGLTRMPSPAMGHPSPYNAQQGGARSPGNPLVALPGQAARSPPLQGQPPRSPVMPLQAPVSPLAQLQMQTAAGFMGPRPGVQNILVSSALSGLHGAGSGSGLLPAHPGSSNFSRTPVVSGAASPAPAGALTPRGGSANLIVNAGSLGSHVPPVSVGLVPQLGLQPLHPQLSAEASHGCSTPVAAANSQGPPRPLSPPAAHQAPTTMHDGVAALLMPHPSEQPTAAPTPPRGRSAGLHGQSSLRASGGSREAPRTSPQLSPTPLSAMQPWDAGWQGGARPSTPGERGSPLPGEHLKLRTGVEGGARGGTPSSPLHPQLSPRVAGPPITTGVTGLATTGVTGLGSGGADLLGRSTPPPGAAAVTTGNSPLRGVWSEALACDGLFTACFRVREEIPIDKHSAKLCANSLLARI